ncbi:MAG TPA: ABC transporter permease [Anaerolineales bacterium]|nr:ABC transporter permease [Anaerolineales bacterium]
MIPFLAVVKKELASVIRDRTIVISILLQLFIASFSSGLLLGMLSLYDADTILQFSGARIKIGIVASPDDTLKTLISKRGLQILQYDTLSNAQAAYYRGEVLAIVDTPQAANGLTEIKLYLPEADAVGSLVRLVIQEPLKQYENVLRTQKGINVRYTDLQGKPATSFEFVYSVIIPLLMFFPTFVSGSMTADSITEEVENNTLQTLLSAPLTVNGLVGAKIISSVILSVLQCIAWLTLLRWNGVAIQNTGWILLLAVIVAGATSVAAAFSAVLLKDRERSQFIYSLMLLAGAAMSTLLNLSPIITLSRLAIGDPYTGGWNVLIFAVLLAGLYLALSKISRKLIV